MSVRNSVSRSFCAAAALLLLAGAFDPALAQLVHHPFAVGASEGAVGHQTALGAWLLGQESRFYLGLTGAVAAARTSWLGAASLIGLSFAYGVFHAAGPGHGKAVITSYMVSNEVALRRGLLVSLLAALFQGFVATALVAIAAFVFDATAMRMTAAAQTIELASYVGIVALGLALVWRKGRAVLASLRPAEAPMPFAFATAGFEAPIALPSASRFRAHGGDELHGPDCGCGHAHMPDPALLTQERFDWKAAGTAIVTAGARPCSGAILVLVFALSQGLFAAGVASTFAMALGTAITTGALATLAVFAKSTAVRLAGVRSSRALLVGRLVELAAAMAVLAFGLVLLVAALGGAHTAA